MITKTFNKLTKVVQKIMKQINKLTKILDKIKHQVDKVVSSVEAFDSNLDYIKDNLKSNKQQVSFIYDLFNVDFSGGPEKCRCWVEFIMNYYVGSNENIKEIYTLLCIMNDIYLDINESILGFIGSALDMIIPESMGLAGTITPLLKAFSYVIYGQIRSKITKDYNKIPYNIRNIIQNPETLKTFIFKKFNKYTLGISDAVIPDSAKKYMGVGIDILAIGIHKGMAMMFMFLNLFIIFSEFNSGINKVLVDQNIKIEKILKDCEYCGEFKVNGINSDGSLNKDDLTNCKRCKKFYINNTNIDDTNIDDAELYPKCMEYKEKRDQAKQAYLKLKNIASKTYTKLNNGVPLSEKLKKVVKKSPGFLKGVVKKVKAESIKKGGDLNMFDDMISESSLNSIIRFKTYKNSDN